MKTKAKIGLFFACAVVIATLLMPWKKIAEMELKSQLAARGFADASFTLESIGTSGLTVRNFSLSGKMPLTLDSLQVDYSLVSLLQKQIDRLYADRLEVRQNGVEAVLEGVTIDTNSWRIEKIQVTQAPLPLPTLSGKGTWKTGEVMTVAGDIASADASHQAKFTLTYGADASRSKLVLESARLPWNDGVVSTVDAVFPLGLGQASKVLLRVDRVPLNALLAAFTSGKATATGVVSGVVPLIIRSGEPLLVQAGELKAEAPGKIEMAPGAIPTGSQMDILAHVLADFYYDQLSMALASADNKKLSAQLIIAGRNPSFQDGRMVKLNVNLTGDVLETVQQSIFPIADPKQFLQQE